ncbi:MAG: hypothetical protein D6791_07735 [Chloroflexi bacterium]|nr:MAG: hypothetical protein D6791_07735 [Chloroflexota bacterium]
MQNTARIAQLEAHVEHLPTDTQELFRQIFDVRTSVGHLVLPQSMHQWTQEHFGSIDAVRTQQVVKVTNLVTWEGALFNELRGRRPMPARADQDFLQSFLKRGDDPFCEPLENTPADTFGRVQGRHAVTASNVAKADGYHAVVIFERHNPFVFTEDEVIDYIGTALRWAQEAHAREPAAQYFFFMWNCSWKAGASILHGHAQATLTQGMHYARVEKLRRDALAYERTHSRNYFDDLFEIHQSLGLGFRWRDVRIMSYLTPVKDGETLLFGDAMSQDLQRALYRVLRAHQHGRPLTSFNVALYMPPIADVEEDWSHFPTMFRVVGRGDPMSLTTDIGAMELYAASVIGTDPFLVADQLRAAFE